MMQTAEPGHRYDLPARYGILRCISTSRRFLGKCKMRAVIMVVADVLFHQSSQMTLVQHDDIVE